MSTEPASEEAPVFVVGSLRSGSTLLRLMLDHHPKIRVFGEFEFAVRWLEEGSSLSVEEYRQLLLSDRVYRTHNFTIDPNLDYGGLVRSFFEQANSGNKPVHGAAVHSNFHFLPRFFPNARFVHIVRDPRDVARSCIGMNWVGNVYHGSRYWIEPIQRWDVLEPTLPEHRKHQLHYEDLIRHPERELANICAFLGLEYSPAMLDYPADTTYSRPDETLVEQWRRKLSSEEIMWVESVCRPLMQKFGYEPYHRDIKPPSKLERARLLLQTRYQRARRNVEIYGAPLYVSWQLTKRLPDSTLRRSVLERKFAVDNARMK